MTPTWHVLGVGAIGQLVAHQFRKQGARVVLLLRSEASLRSFKDAGESLTVQRLAPPSSRSAQGALMWQTETSTGYSSYVVGVDGDCSDAAELGAIENLLVAVKAHHAVEALRQLRGRIGSQTNLVLLQNGMGVPEMLREQVFPSKYSPGCGMAGTDTGEQQQPAMIIGIAKHGCKRDPALPFTVQHTTQPSTGKLLFGPAVLGPRGIAGNWQEQQAVATQEALASLGVLLKDLGAEVLSAAELREVQRQKLLANACINPLTALLGCRNGELLDNPWARGIMADVCREGVAVFSAIDTATEQVSSSRAALETSDERDRRAAATALSEALEVAAATAQNRSSMLQDIEGGRTTEISFINGYIADEARNLGLSAPVNETLRALMGSKDRLQATMTAVGSSAGCNDDDRRP